MMQRAQRTTTIMYFESNVSVKLGPPHDIHDIRIIQYKVFEHTETVFYLMRHGEVAESAGRSLAARPGSNQST